nr:hypothetical protein KXZ65_03970 [Pectobacterium sp. PL152]
MAQCCLWLLLTEAGKGLPQRKKIQARAKAGFCYYAGRARMRGKTLRKLIAL